MPNKIRLNKITQIANNEEAAVALFNANVDKVNKAIEDSVSRSGAVPTEMQADLDMSGKRIINLGEPKGDLDPVRYKDIQDIAPSVKAAEAAAEKAAAYANEAIRAADYSASQKDEAKDMAELSQAWAVADDFDDRLEGESSSKAYSNLAMAIANAPEDVPVNMSELQSRTILKGDSATLRIANVSTLPAGQEAYVRNIGTERDAIFEIGLPRADNDHYAQGNLGDIRSTTAWTLPKGCAWCDGSWKTQAEYPDMYEAVRTRQVAVQSVSLYETHLSNYGCCAYFVLDEAGKRFRIPTLKGNIMFGVASGVSPFEYGRYQPASLPQHGHAVKTNVNSFAYVDQNLTYNPVEAVAFNSAISHYAASAQRITSMLSTVANYEGGSPVGSVSGFATGSTVQPEALLLHYYVVLSESRKSIYCPKPSVATFADLPMSGNILGDTRVTLDTSIMYVWAQTAKGSYTWTSIGSSVPAGGVTLAEWGSVGGDITAQEDLQEELSKKLENANTGPNKHTSVEISSSMPSAYTSTVAILGKAEGSRAVSLGTYSAAKALSVAIGSGATTDPSSGANANELAVAIGSNAQAGYRSVVLGANASGGNTSVVVGENAKTSGGFSVAIGIDAEAPTYGTSIGYGAKVGTYASGAIQIGPGTNSTPSSLSVGFKIVKDDDGDGQEDPGNDVNYTLLTSDGKIPVERLPEDIGGLVDLTGYLQNTATGTNGIAILGTSSITDGIALGSGSISSGSGYGIAIGTSSQATARFAVGLGMGARATAENAVQLGNGTNSTANTLQFKSYPLLDANGKIPAERLPDDIGGGGGGLENTATGSSALALLGGTASGNHSVAIGANTQALGNRCITIGEGATTSSTYESCVAIGDKSTAKNNGAVAVGNYASATGNYGTAVGKSATASGGFSTALGQGASASGSNSTALGYSASATKSFAIQLGKGTNSTANTLSVGLKDNLNVQLLGANGKIPGERMSLQGTSAPDTATVGSIGQFYVDTATGTGYMCVGVSGSTYTWKQITV